MPRGLLNLSILAILLVSLLLGCSGKKEVKDTTFDPQKSLADADKLIKNKDYDEARKTLLQVKNRAEDKSYAVTAQLKIAESYLAEGEPDLAIEEYRRFIDLYPDNQYAAYAQYQIAMAYFNQIESPDRGSGEAQKALNEFLKLKRDYPRNPYRETIDMRIERCRNILAEAEFMVGQFYYKKESYNSAIRRFEGILKNYPDYKNIEEVYFLTAKSYKALKNDTKASELFKILLDKFPTSKFAVEARKSL